MNFFEAAVAQEEAEREYPIVIEQVDDFEIDAIAMKETETALFRMKTGMAFEAQSRNASRWLAELWGCSAQSINTLARIFETFDYDAITPDIPLSLWNAVMETDNPQAWLGRAIAEGLSARSVRDANDSIKGKHLSSTAFRGRVTITEWDVPTGHVAAEGLQISGDMPLVAEMTVREVLQE